jgi:hypothetical protein
VDLGGVDNHVVQDIHKENEQSRRERAALFDPRVEINAKGIRPICGSKTMSISEE